jgi:protein O-mannosyl-transferase
MSKSKKELSKQPILPQNTLPPPLIVSDNPSGFFANTRLQAILIFVFGVLLYANTFTHDFTLDDSIVITENMFTTDGVKGIGGILKYDTFYGFFKESGKAALVAGGRYRPLTLVFFAMEYQIFGKNPLPYHVITVFLFALTCVLVYFTLLKLFLYRFSEMTAATMAFAAALLFTAHPVHTEAVANIKGSDEIVTLLGSLGAVLLSLKAFETRKMTWSIAAGIVFFLALLAKENAITFLAIVPMLYFVFCNAKIGDILKQTLPFIAAAALFLVVRTAVIGASFGDTPLELMNNPYLKLQGNTYVPVPFMERMATVIFTLGWYIKLLFLPHPLTHDYYPRHVEIMSFGNGMVILSVLLYLALGIWAIRGILKKDIIAFGVLFYLATLSIVSNLIFPIGTNMGERFLFMPSVGFCIALVALCERLKLRKEMLLSIFVGVAGLFGITTILRNPAWKDNYTLFSTDIHTSVNSAKLQNALGGELNTKAEKAATPALREKYAREALTHLEKAVKIHPFYKNAYLLMGNCYYYSQDYENAVLFYQKCLTIDSGYKDALSNLPVAYRDLGKYYGEKKNDLPRAFEALNKSYQMRPEDAETLRLLGVANAFSGKPQVAIEFFEKALKIQPDNARTIFDTGTAYMQVGNTQKAKELHDKAIELDPTLKNN